MIKVIEVNSENRVGVVSRETYLKMLAQTKKALEQIGRYGLEKKNSRFSYDSGISFLGKESQVIITDYNPEGREFRAVFTARSELNKTCYSVQFQFHRDVLTWLLVVIKILDKFDIPALKVIFEDSMLGQFLNRNWINTFYISPKALKAFVKYACSISRSLESLEADHFHNIWVDGCKQNNAGEQATRVASLCLVQSLIKDVIKTLQTS